MVERIEAVLQHFQADSIARTAYVCALTDFPELFREEPAAMIIAINLAQSNESEPVAFDRRVCAFARRVGESLNSALGREEPELTTETPDTRVSKAFLTALSRVLAGRAA